MSTSFLNRTLLIAAFFTANVDAQDQTSEKISVDATVVSQIAPHLASQNTKPIPPLVATYSIFAKGNFGRAIKTSESVERRQLENGLYEVTGNRSDPNGSSGNGTALSLCGLTNVLAVGASRNVTIGSSFAAGATIEMRFSSETENSSHLVRFESDAPSLCNLSPGINFKYWTDGVNTLNLKRQVLRDKKLEFAISAETDCKTPESKQPSSEISESLSGDYLRISCVTSNKNGKKDSTTLEIAYLIDYHYYLPLKTTTNSARTEIQYSAPNLTHR